MIIIKKDRTLRLLTVVGFVAAIADGGRGVGMWICGVCIGLMVLTLAVRLGQKWFTQEQA